MNNEKITPTQQQCEELEKAYIGKNYNKIDKNIFSLPSLLLGEIYYIYKNMYLYGFIIFICRNIFFILFYNGTFKYFIIINTIFSFFISFFTNKLCIRNAKNKVKKLIKRLNQNTNKIYTYEELYNICKRKNSIKSNPIIMIVFCAVMSLLISFILGMILAGIVFLIFSPMANT